jgi:hypothetical protein
MGKLRNKPRNKAQLKALPSKQTPANSFPRGQLGLFARLTRLKSIGREIVIGVLASLTAAGVVYFFVTRQESLRTSTVGTISTQLKPHYSKDVSPVIFLGHTVFVFETADFLGKPFKMGDPFRIWAEHERLMIEATFRDQSGAIVAAMHGDEWVVNRNKSFDRNFSSGSIEVLDERGDVAFHVAMCTYGAVLEAKFHGQQGRSFAIASGRPNVHDDQPKTWTAPGPPDAMLYTFPVKWSDNGTAIRKLGTEPDSTAYFEYGLIGQHLITNLQPWFRYPSSRFLGEMIVSEPEICRANAPSYYFPSLK